ncbi:MAG: cyclodeaminase/cyclohydrolase family protein [Methanobacteriota archaeon]
MGKLVEMKLAGFLDELASKSPAPGGGSVAALSGALGAALSSMVCNLTFGKEDYAAVQKELQDVFKQSEQLRKHLTLLIDKDTEAFNEVMHALKMPKDSEEQKEQRKRALQTGFKHAAQVPLETAQACERVLDVALLVAEKGNKNSITDAAVSALLAHAGVESALLNVKINLSSIKDAAFVQTLSSDMEQVQQNASDKTKQILDIVDNSL